MNNYNKQLDSTENFIESVIARKYLIENEKSYKDMVLGRFEPYLKQRSSKYEYAYQTFRTFAKKELDWDLPQNMEGAIVKQLLQRDIIPGGSISFGLGNKANCSLSNCYFTPIEEDSLTAIFEATTKLSKIFQYRGGSGIDLSILRPAGTPVNNSARTSSGPVSFMPKINQDAATVGQNGRRAALMISMAIWHPDIELFIKSKTFPEEVFKDVMSTHVPDISTANISVLVTKDFIEALRNGTTYKLRFPDLEDPHYSTEWKGDIFAWEAKGYKIKVHKEVDPKDIIKLISDCAHKSGDPGVLNWENHTKYSMGYFDELTVPRGVNPCSEQSLPNYGNCLLSAVNLTACVANPYNYKGTTLKTPIFNYNKLYVLTYLNALFLNMMIDSNEHPLAENNVLDKYSRRIGIEFTGLGDVYAMLGIKYGSAESLELAQYIGLVMLEASLSASIIIGGHFAEEHKLIHNLPDVFLQDWKKGIRVNYEKVKDFYKQPFFTRVYKSLEKLDGQGYIYGFLPKFTTLNTLRSMFNNKFNYSGRELNKIVPANTSLLTVGPTGTISIIAGNVTSGIEPIFALSYKRRSIITNGEFIDVIHAPLLRYLNKNNISYDSLSELKDRYFYVEANDIPYEDRLAVQRSIQTFVDTSISSTVNLPSDVSPKVIEDIFTKVILDDTLKGVTVFRDKSKEGVLSVTGSIKKEEAIETQKSVAPYNSMFIKQRDYCERSFTFTEKWKQSKLYIIVTIDSEGNPMEVFTIIPKAVAMREVEINGIKTKIFDENLYREYSHLWHLVCRLISALLRTGYPLDELFAQLDKSVHNPLTDLGAIVNRVLTYVQKQQFEENNVIEELQDYIDEQRASQESTESITLPSQPDISINLGICPQCGERTYMRVSGCGNCLNEECSYSSCG